MSIIDLFRKKKEEPTETYDQLAVEIGRLSAARQTAETNRVDPNQAVSREDRGYHIQDITDYRYNDVDTLIKLLSKINPDVSASVWNFLRLLDSGLKVTALDAKLLPNAKFQETLNQILFRLSGASDFKIWDLRMSVQQTANQMAKYVLLRGGTGLEAELGKDKRLYKLNVVDAINVKFKQPKKGLYLPFQTDT